MVDHKENYKFYLGVRELTSYGYSLRVISLYCPQFVLKGHWKLDHSNKTKNNFFKQLLFIHISLPKSKYVVFSGEILYINGSIMA